MTQCMSRSSSLLHLVSTRQNGLCLLDRVHLLSTRLLTDVEILDDVIALVMDTLQEISKFVERLLICQLSLLGLALLALRRGQLLLLLSDGFATCIDAIGGGSHVRRVVGLALILAGTHLVHGASGICDDHLQQLEHAAAGG